VQGYLDKEILAVQLQPMEITALAAAAVQAQ
jgi:hypothetical protein